MRENQRFPEPIITPTTKADEGHDMNISKEEIIAQGIVSAEDYAVMEETKNKFIVLSYSLYDTTKGDDGNEELLEKTMMMTDTTAMMIMLPV